MDSDVNSDITLFHTISQFDYSDLETPDEFANSEPSPSLFFQPHFQPIHSQAQTDSPITISHISQLTPTYSPFTNERSNNSSPDTTQISYDLNHLITLQQQVQHPHTLTIHQLLSTITSSNPLFPIPSSDYTLSLAQSSTSTQSSSTTSRAYRTSERKFPNHPFPSKPGIARNNVNHPYHTNTRQHVDEHVLIPTLHWTSFYLF